jgi:hypothetical protein
MVYINGFNDKNYFVEFTLVMKIQHWNEDADSTSKRKLKQKFCTVYTNR